MVKGKFLIKRKINTKGLLELRKFHSVRFVGEAAAQISALNTNKGVHFLEVEQEKNIKL